MPTSADRLIGSSAACAACPAHSPLPPAAPPTAPPPRLPLQRRRAMLLELPAKQATRAAEVAAARQQLEALEAQLDEQQRTLQARGCFRAVPLHALLGGRS